MKQIKVFSSSSANAIEQEVNNFLASLLCTPDIKFSATSDSFDVMVVYEVFEP